MHGPATMARASVQQEWEFVNSLDRTAISNALSGWRLYGTIDPDTAEAAVNEVVARHEILRTHLAEINDEIVQVIVPELTVRLGIEDFGGRPGRQRGRAVTRWTGAQLRLPIPLDELPQLRAQLFLLGPQESLLLLIVPHAIWDGVSSEVFIQEFVASYDALARGETSLCTEPELQYADLAEWDRSRAAPDRQSASKPWDSTKDVPVLFPQRTARFSNRVRAAPLPAIASAFVDALHREACSAGATLLMALIASVGALLHVRTGRSDVRVGVVDANRVHPETSGVIGYVAGIMPVTLDIRGELPFAQLLAQSRDKVLAFYEAEPSMAAIFPQATRHAPDRRPAACEVLLNYIPRADPAPVSDPSGLSVAPYSPSTWRSVVDGATEWEFFTVEFTLGPLPGPAARAGRAATAALHGRLGFNARTLTPDSATALATDFVRLVRLVALRPHMPVNSLRDRLAKLSRTLPREGFAWTGGEPGMLVRSL